MEVFIRFITLLLTPLAVIIKFLLDHLLPAQKPTYPAIRDAILTKSVTELTIQLRRKQITSQQLVQAYIERINEVNPSLNAVVEERFEAALQEAKHADEMIAKAKNDFELLQLFTQYPLLGIPFTVKESCGVKDLSYAVGSIVRKTLKCQKDGHVVGLLRSAGCIPLLVSANPEFCFSIETSSHIMGACVNPYDLRRTSAGSSGGEAALNGAGASTFGLASDISGSIRLPAAFCGVFGHKPTGGLISTVGHFPNSTQDSNVTIYLQLGPITRFACDLPLLLQVMVDVDKRQQLNFDKQVKLKELKIYYAYGHCGFNSLTHPPVEFDIKLAITKAIKCFEKIGIKAQKLDLGFYANSMEICTIGLVDIKGIPSVITQQNVRGPSMKMLIIEMLNSLVGYSLFTKEALFAELMCRLNGCILRSRAQSYREELPAIKKFLLDKLGNNGILILPTFHSSALHFNTSMLHFMGIDYMLLFNLLGFPATHVPMGLNGRGLPIGIQVVAAPYQDRLCLQIAAELEGAFDGWVPPLPHEIDI